MQSHRILIKSFYWKLLHFLVVLCSNILVVRFFKAEITGTFYTLIYVASLMVSIFNLGLDVSINYFLSKRNISISTVRKLILSIICVALIVSVPSIYLYLNRIVFPILNDTAVLFLICIFISGGLTFNFTSAIYTSQHENYIVNKTAFFFGVISLVLSMATILIAERDIAVTTLFYIHFFFTFLPGFFLLLRTFFRGKLWAYDIEAVNLIPLRNVFIFSLSAYASNIIFFIASKMAVFILPFWADPLHLGNFMQAYKIVEYAGMVTAFIYFPMISISADQTTFNSEAIILFLVRLSNTFVIFASISIMFAGPYAFQIIFGDSFFQLHEILICFIPGMLAVCSSTFFTAYFFGKGKTKINFYSAVILLSSLSLLMFVFANNGNVKWAAIAFSIANMLSFMYDIYQFNFLHKFTWKEIMILNKMDLLKLKLIFIANVSKVKSNAI